MTDPDTNPEGLTEAQVAESIATWQARADRDRASLQHAELRVAQLERDLTKMVMHRERQERKQGEQELAAWREDARAESPGAAIARSRAGERIIRMTENGTR